MGLLKECCHLVIFLCTSVCRTKVVKSWSLRKPTKHVTKYAEDARQIWRSNKFEENWMAPVFKCIVPIMSTPISWLAPIELELVAKYICIPTEPRFDSQKWTLKVKFISTFNKRKVYGPRYVDTKLFHGQMLKRSRTMAALRCSKIFDHFFINFLT
jgi:hypothetical protein